VAASGTPWTLHSFGYTAGLPDAGEYSGSLVFELVRKAAGVRIAQEPIGCPGVVVVNDVGDRRKVLSVVADAPVARKRQLVRAVDVHIDGLKCGGITFDIKDAASVDRTHSIVLGDPTHFTYDRSERLAVRNAVWTVEDKHLPGELTRKTVPGLPRELLVEADARAPVPLDRERTIEEVRNQLMGALRADSWGYLWKWSSAPTPADGAAISMSSDMTMSMAEHLHDVTETMLRACGVKPQRENFEPGTDALDAVAYALAAMRRGVSLDEATDVVVDAVMRYGSTVELTSLRASADRRLATRRLGSLDL
jgi:hypothetical protein